MSLSRRPDDEIGKSRWGVRYSAFGQQSFCAVLEGSCRLTVDDHRPLILEASDFVLLPATPGFTMPGFEPVGGEFAIRALSHRSEELARPQFWLRERPMIVSMPTTAGHSSATTTACGISSNAPAT